MTSPRLGIAAGNKLGAQAAAGIAQQGGNAVDACLAAGIVGCVAEPFFASIGGSGFVAIRSPEGAVEIYDGNNTMPLTVPEEPGQGIRRIFLTDYADGIYRGIGGGSVAVPGYLAAIHEAWVAHGHIEWAALFEDAIRIAREGFSFPKTSDYYLSCTWDALWSTYPEPATTFSVDDRPMREGERLVQPQLADALEAIASGGPEVFYGGELGQEISEAIARDGGFLSVQDLKSFEVAVRSPISTHAFGWTVESNPPPAVGGAVLVHMLALLEASDLTEPADRLSAIVEAQRAAVGYRKERYQDPDGVAAAFDQALAGIQRSRRSSATSHTSSADADGYVCSLTESNGYGAGLVVQGILLNNTLGEEELNPLGAHRLPPGSRCHSNQAPTVASKDGRAIALGSPGADRIVGAIAQTFLRVAVDGASLADAVAAPRAHLDPRVEGETLCFEPGLPGEELPYKQRPYDELHMYFGAVQAASVDADGVVDAAHDPRRSGGSALI
ncbi:MAG: gamma-glutamyltransferase family protein [Actinomycetota bacterium]|nr:gamma-glutamyltransferase family protein [Actinomycetota bacterium]